MNIFWIYLLQIAITAAISVGIVAYFRPHLHRVLVDLCGTPERAQFWVVFSSILLVGVPLIFGMGYNPLESEAERLFFDTARQVRTNLLGLLLALFGIGFSVSFFALVAPRPATK